MLNDSVVYNLMVSRPQAFRRILDSIEKYELQIIYIQVDRNRRNEPYFTQHAYRLNPNVYFNPASLVKLPIVCLAFQKLHALKAPGLDKFTRLSIIQTHNCPTGIQRDPSSRNGYPSIAHLANKMLIVSDNEAYSQMFEFLGWDDIHRGLFALGYKDVRIVRRFCGCSYEENRYTNPVTFFDSRGKVLMHQPSLLSDVLYQNPPQPILKGKRHLNERFRPVNGPYDYSNANQMGLQDAMDMLRSVMFPESVPVSRRFSLTDEDLRFIYRALSILPRESDFPRYADRRLYPDNVKKYFLYGDLSSKATISDKNARLFNSVGFSDGFLSDCAYIVDFEKKIEFFLGAVIYVNEDEVVRDGTYEYQTVGLPFLAELGRTVYEYEKQRKRWFVPDLSRFRIRYP